MHIEKSLINLKLSFEIQICPPACSLNTLKGNGMSYWLTLALKPLFMTSKGLHDFQHVTSSLCICF